MNRHQKQLSSSLRRLRLCGKNSILLDALKQYVVGDVFTYNSPTVLGKAVSIGNGFGWAMGIPLADVGG